jgi:hypothetical protein
MSLWPENEVDTVIAARIQGQSDNKIRSLVANLVAKRKDAK